MEKRSWKMESGVVKMDEEGKLGEGSWEEVCIGREYKNGMKKGSWKIGSGVEKMDRKGRLGEGSLDREEV